MTAIDIATLKYLAQVLHEQNIEKPRPDGIARFWFNEITSDGIEIRCIAGSGEDKVRCTMKLTWAHLARGRRAIERIVALVDGKVTQVLAEQSKAA